MGFGSDFRRWMGDVEFDGSGRKECRIISRAVGHGFF